MNIIDGKKLAEQIKLELLMTVRGNDLDVGLAIILVGDDPGSITYVRLKKEAAEKIGIKFHLYRFPNESQQTEIETTIDWLNADPETDGIIIQLPLPKHLDEQALIGRIDPAKDADGFHPKNIQRFLAHKEQEFMPGLIEGILLLIAETKKPLEGKQAVIVVNSTVFSEPLAASLGTKGLAVQTILQPKKDDLAKLKNADVLIAAIGKKHFISSEYVKSDSIIIDVGYNRENGDSFGDIDQHSFKDAKGWITPVPGGVGPMTVAILLKRVIELHIQHHAKS